MLRRFTPRKDDKTPLLKIRRGRNVVDFVVFVGLKPDLFAGVKEISVRYNTIVDVNGNLEKDEHGNITGLVGEFKRIVDGIGEVVQKVIDALFKMIRG